MELDACVHIDACRKAYGEEGYPAQCRFEMLGRVYRCPLYETERVNRAALLALADEMGRVRSKCDFCIKKGDCDWADETICLESRIDDYARCIREALGVSE